MQEEHNGLELLQQIRQQNTSSATTPYIVIISADSSEQSIQRAVELGANGYLTKPFSSNNIVQIIQSFAAKASDN